MKFCVVSQHQHRACAPNHVGARRLAFFFFRQLNLLSLTEVYLNCNTYTYKKERTMSALSCFICITSYSLGSCCNSRSSFFRFYGR